MRLTKHYLGVMGHEREDLSIRNIAICLHYMEIEKIEAPNRIKSYEKASKDVSYIAPYRYAALVKMEIENALRA